MALQRHPPTVLHLLVLVLGLSVGSPARVSSQAPPAPRADIARLLADYQARLERAGLHDRYTRQSSAGEAARVKLEPDQARALQAISESFLRALATAEPPLSLRDLQQFRDATMAAGGGGNPLFSGQRAWDSTYLGTERALMAGRTELVQSAWKATLQDFFQAHPDAVGVVYGRIDIGSWVKNTLGGLSFAGDIDFSSVSTSPEFNAEVRQRFAAHLAEHTGLDMVQADALLTAHGQATADVFIGDWGRTFAELDMLKRSGWSLIQPRMKDGKPVLDANGRPIIDEVPRRPGDLFWEQALRSGEAVQFPMMDLDKEPMLSLEMLRHGIHDVEHGPFQRGQKIVKMLKYVERSYFMNKKAVAASGWNPYAENDPVMAEVADKVVQNKNDIAALVELMHTLAGEEVTAGNVDAVVDKITARAQTAMHDNATRALAFRLQALAGMSDDLAREQAAYRLWTDLNTELEAFRGSGVEEPAVMRQAAEMAADLIEGKLSVEELERRANELHALLNDAYKLPVSTIDRIGLWGPILRLRIYFRTKLMWKDEQIARFIDAAKKRYPQGGAVYDALQKATVELNGQLERTTAGSGLMTAADFADNAFQIYDAYLSGKTQSEKLYATSLMMGRVALLRQFPSLQIPAGFYDSVMQAVQRGRIQPEDATPLAMAVAFTYFPFAGQVYMVGGLMQRANVAATDAGFFSELNRMMTNVDFKDGRISRFVLKNPISREETDTADVNPPGDRDQVVTIFDDPLSPFSVAANFRYWRSLVPTPDDQFGRYEDKLEKLSRFFAPDQNVQRAVLMLKQFKTNTESLPQDGFQAMREDALRQMEDRLRRTVWVAMADALESAIAAVSARADLEGKVRAIEADLAVDDAHLGREKGLLGRITEEIGRQSSLFTGENPYAVGLIFDRYINAYGRIQNIRRTILNDVWQQPFQVDYVAAQSAPMKILLVGPQLGAPALTGDLERDVELAEACLAAHRARGEKIRADLSSALGRSIDESLDADHLRRLGQLGFEWEHLLDAAPGRMAGADETAGDALGQRLREYKSYLATLAAPALAVTIEGPSSAPVGTAVRMSGVVTREGPAADRAPGDVRLEWYRDGKLAGGSRSLDLGSPPAGVIELRLDAVRNIAGEKKVLGSRVVKVEIKAAPGADAPKPPPEKGSAPASRPAAGPAAPAVPAAPAAPTAPGAPPATAPPATPPPDPALGVWILRSVDDETEPQSSCPPNLLTERNYYDAEKKQLRTEYTYYLQFGMAGHNVRCGSEKKYFQSGKLSYEGTRQDDQLEGKLTRYWETGAVFDVTTYLSGIRHGAYVSYYHDGKKRSEGLYQDDRKAGPWTYYSPKGEVELQGGRYHVTQFSSELIGDLACPVPFGVVPSNPEEGLHWQCGGNSSLDAEVVRAFKARTPSGAETGLQNQVKALRTKHQQCVDELRPPKNYELCTPIEKEMVALEGPMSQELAKEFAEIRASTYAATKPAPRPKSSASAGSVEIKGNSATTSFQQGQATNTSSTTWSEFPKRVAPGERVPIEVAVKAQIAGKSVDVFTTVESPGTAAPAARAQAGQSAVWTGLAGALFANGAQPGASQTVRVTHQGPGGKAKRSYVYGWEKAAGADTAGAVATVSVTAAAGGRITLGQSSPVHASLAIGDQKATGQFVYRWQPNPEVAFAPVEGATPSATAVFTKIGRVKVWVDVLQMTGGRLATVTQSDQIEIDVVPPELKLAASAEARPGREVRVTATTQPNVSDEHISFWWEYKGNAVSPGPAANPRVYTFTPKDISPVTVTVHAKARDGGDDLGSQDVTVLPRPFDVRVTGPRQAGPAPQTWNPAGGGLVDVARAITTFQNVSMRAEIAPAPDHPPLHYAWTVTSDSCSISNPISQEPTFNCREPGGYGVAVVVRDDLGCTLGTGTGSLSVTAPPSGGTSTAPSATRPAPPVPTPPPAAAAAPLVEQGTGLYDASKYAEAADAFTRAIAADPKSAPAYAGRCLAKRGLLDNDGALADCERALQLDPRNADAYRGRSMVKRATNNAPGALTDGTRAVELAPSNYRAYLTRGLAREELNDLAGALADYEKSIAIHPNYAMAYFYRGRVKFGRQDYTGAIADYDQSIQMNPGHASSFFNRARAKYATKDNVGALVDYDRYISTNATDSAAFNNRALVKERLGDNPGAIADYERAIAINPNYEVAKRNLANLRERMAKAPSPASPGPLKSGRYHMRANEYPFDVMLTVSGSTFVGRTVGSGVERAIRNGIVSGDTVTFHLDVEGFPQGQDYKGTIAGGKITGTFTGAPRAIGAQSWAWGLDLTPVTVK